MPGVTPARSIASPDGGEAPSPADAEPPIGLLIEVVHEAGDWGLLDDASEAVLAAAAELAAELEITASAACVALSSDGEVERLNTAYRGKAAPTNVLSFPAGPVVVPATYGEPRFLGDLVLAAETVAREAKDLGVPLKHHLQHLVVHGLLHLLGYDHEREEDAETMEALEVRILARLGIADPYAAAGEPLSPCQDQTELAKP
ncbi:MAG TPA: rRNA maturation RNase YbeY [Hyphomicrobium sp.]